MKSIIAFLFIAGLFMIVHGIYEQKYQALKNSTKIEYRFIPKTFLEEQLADSTVSATLKDTLNGRDPWLNATVGSDKILKTISQK